MNLQINQIDISNFRQAGERSFEFGKGKNLIVGANGTGKTNTLHAITWCLFGKDLDDRSKFDIVPLNADNTSSQLEPDVTLHLTIDGTPHKLRRQLQNGKATQTYIDDMPTSTLKRYDEFVADIFASPDRFKMFTNPLYFPEMNWKNQRELFMQFFPMPTAAEVIGYMAKQDKELKDLVKADLEKIAPEDLQEKLNLDKKTIDSKRDKVRAQIELLDEQLEGQQLYDEADLIKERDDLRAKVNSVSADVKEISAYNQGIEISRTEKEDQIRKLKAEADARALDIELKHNKRISDLKIEIQQLTAERDAAASDYKQLKVIDGICPTCKQPIPEADFAKRVADADAMRAKSLDKGVELGKRILLAKDQLAALEGQGIAEDQQMAVGHYYAEIDNLKKELYALPERKPVPVIDNELIERLDVLERTLARGEVHQENLDRRNALMEQERQMNTDYETCERKLQDLADIFYYRSEMIVNAVNSQFKTISVKVLEIQKNGIPKDTFEITANGVPFSELNTAGKLQAGLELSEFFKKQFDISCPILIDNGERYTDISFADIEGQLIIALAETAAKLHVQN